MRRSLELESRKEETKEKIVPEVVRFEILDIHKHYKDSVVAIDEMFLIADDFVRNGNESQAQNIWRAQIVFLVSALDFFMHEITKYGLGKIFEGKWESTEKFKNISISIDILNKALKAGENTDWFIEFINKQFSLDTMVSYSSIKNQMSMLGLDIKIIADCSFYEQNSKKKTMDRLKECLNDLYERRNIIAHQSARKHSNAEVIEVNKDDVCSFINDVNKIVDSIVGQINEK